MQDSVTYWCERGDSNPHGFTRQILSLVRLPIPPLSHSLRQFKPKCLTLDRFTKQSGGDFRSVSPRNIRELAGPNELRRSISHCYRRTERRTELV
jgi:hypothetical protein